MAVNKKKEIKELQPINNKCECKNYDKELSNIEKLLTQILQIITSINLFIQHKKKSFSVSLKIRGGIRLVIREE